MFIVLLKFPACLSVSSYANEFEVELEELQSKGEKNWGNFIVLVNC